MTTSKLDWYHIIAIGLVFFSFVMAALASRTVFERVPHLEDEVAYLYQARIFAGGQVVIDIPQPRRAFWQPFVIDYLETGKRFGKYPPGWPALLAVGLALGEAWTINAFFAALTVVVVYRLGREIFNRDVGVIAAALTAFSPMALLLNATLMGHTAALFCLTLFMYAYWRIEKQHHPNRWGLVAGITLGVLVINRPLTAVGVVLPFVVWSTLKVLRLLRDTRYSVPDSPEIAEETRYRVYDQQLLVDLFSHLRPYWIISGLTLMIAAAIPLFNYAATGDPTKNLYTLVWQYDRVGFGSCCGRSSQNNGAGHTIVKGVRHARYDLSLMAADLFGWQVEPITDEIKDHLVNHSDYYPALGLSFFLLPLGLFIGLRESWLRWWLIGGMVWFLVPLVQDYAFLDRDEHTVWLWLAVLALWLMIPPAAFAFSQTKHEDRSRWTWLLLGVAAGLVSVHLAYWVGSQRYSTRYYFEALSALALLSALPIAWIAQRLSRAFVLGLLAVVLVGSLFYYSLPRINVLYRFNQISPEMAAQVEARKTDDRPLLVLVNGQVGNVRWRSFGPLMVVTSPYLDSEIVAAWNYELNNDTVRQQILEQFPDRQIVEMQAADNAAWFIESCTPRPGLAGMHDCLNTSGS